MYNYPIDRVEEMSQGYSSRRPGDLRAFGTSQKDADSRRIPRFDQRPMRVTEQTFQVPPDTPLVARRKAVRRDSGLKTPSPTPSVESIDKRHAQQDSARDSESGSRRSPNRGTFWTSAHQYISPASSNNPPPVEQESPTLHLSFQPLRPLRVIDRISPKLHQVKWRPADPGSPRLRHYPGGGTSGFDPNQAHIAAKKAELAFLDRQLQDITARVEILQLLKLDVEKSPLPTDEVIHSTIDLSEDQNPAPVTDEKPSDNLSAGDIFTDARARSVSLDDFPPPPYSEPRRLSPGPSTATQNEIDGSSTCIVLGTTIAASVPCTPVRKVDQGIKMVQVRRSPTRRDVNDTPPILHHKDSQCARTRTVRDVQPNGLRIEGLSEGGVRTGCPVAVSQVISSMPRSNMVETRTPTSRRPPPRCPSTPARTRPAVYPTRERQSSSWPPQNPSSHPRALKPPPPRTDFKTQAKHEDPFYVSDGSNPTKWTVHNLHPTMQRGIIEPSSIGTVSKPREWSIIGPRMGGGSSDNDAPYLPRRTRTSQHITNFSVQKRKRSSAQLISRAGQYSRRSVPLLRKILRRSTPPTRIDPSRLRLEVPRLTSSGFGLEQAILEELRMRSEKSRELFRRPKSRNPSRPISIRTLRRHEICWPAERQHNRSAMNSVDLKSALNGSHCYYGFIPTLRPKLEQPKRTLSRRLVEKSTPSTLHRSNKKDGKPIESTIFE